MTRESGLAILTASRCPSVSCELTEGFCLRCWVARGGFGLNQAAVGLVLGIVELMSRLRPRL